jgi:hypothetical protein
MARKIALLLVVLSFIQAARGISLWDAAFVPHSGTTQVTAGSTVTIDLIADFDVRSGVFNIQQSTTSSAGDATAVGVGVLHSGFDQIADNGNLCNVLSGTRFILIDRINGEAATASPDILAGQILYSFDLLIPSLASAGDQFTIDDPFGSPVVNGADPYATAIYGAGGESLTDITSLTLTVIPEPATVALLAFGSLCLFRKRKT